MIRIVHDSGTVQDVAGTILCINNVALISSIDDIKCYIINSVTGVVDATSCTTSIDIAHNGTANSIDSDTGVVDSIDSDTGVVDATSCNNNTAVSSLVDNTRIGNDKTAVSSLVDNTRINVSCTANTCTRHNNNTTTRDDNIRNNNTAAGIVVNFTCITFDIVPIIEVASYTPP